MTFLLYSENSRKKEKKNGYDILSTDHEDLTQVEL